MSWPFNDIHYPPSDFGGSRHSQWRQWVQWLRWDQSLGVDKISKKNRIRIRESCWVAKRRSAKVPHAHPITTTINQVRAKMTCKNHKHSHWNVWNHAKQPVIEKLMEFHGRRVDCWSSRVQNIGAQAIKVDATTKDESLLSFVKILAHSNLQEVMRCTWEMSEEFGRNVEEM